MKIIMTLVAAAIIGCFIFKNIETKTTSTQFQPCVWPNPCVAVAQFQPCVWPNRC